MKNISDIAHWRCALTKIATFNLLCVRLQRRIGKQRDSNLCRLHIFLQHRRRFSERNQDLAFIETNCCRIEIDLLLNLISIPVHTSGVLSTCLRHLTGHDYHWINCRNFVDIKCPRSFCFKFYKLLSDCD